MSAKALFLIWNFGISKHLEIAEIAGIFWYGLKMDISTACYLLIVPGILLSMRIFLPDGFISRFLQVYTFLFLIFSSVLIVLDLGLYPHWGTRVNVTLFNYIDDPVAVSASVSVKDIFFGLLVGGVVFALFVFFYRFLFRHGFSHSQQLKWWAIPLQLFIVASLILPIRGGLDTSPLNLSSVAFSPKMYVNQSATNFLWNFAKSVEKRKRFSNPCQYLDKAESIRVFQEFQELDTLVHRPQLIKLNPAKQPNVLLIILEGFSNKVIAELGGMKGVTPNLDSLCKQSTVFTNFYSTGSRSDRGISAVLGGYPSLLSTSIMVYPEKTKGLTLLPEYFNRKNYYTSFYYGGDINFYNLKSFVLKGNFGRLVTKADFPAELGRMSKWGVPDGYVLERATEDLKNEQEPFMKTIYTISSHPPFDVPFSKFPGKTYEEQYLNSVAYTDSCLGAFIDSFRKTPLWANTLLIVTSDHGTNQPGPTEINDLASYRIPLIWSGGVVDSLHRIETITRQFDLGVSLVHQLGWESDSTRFAKDFFTARPHAFYMHDSGWGYIVPEGSFYFDQNSGTFDVDPASKSVKVDYPKAFMQVLHEDFITR